ncbi:hypothetical protein G9A89_014215 [Geosiphon pyriformis]|nr:hypothetical protein G9A89_014215 [Geosiphon pyriformis]
MAITPNLIRSWLQFQSSNYFVHLKTKPVSFFTRGPLKFAISRFYSSSSSSSSGTKRAQQPPSKQELTFVALNYVDPRDLAHSTFFALHRPLPTINDQLAPVWDAGQQQSQGLEDEEEYDEDGLTAHSTIYISINSTSTTHPLLINPGNLLSPLQPSSFAMTSTESQQVINRFFSEIEASLKKEEEESEDFELLEVQRIRPTEQIDRPNEPDTTKELDLYEDEITEKREREGRTSYMSNIRQKRRLKMNKHKHKKLRKRQRALKRRLGKI